MRSLSTRTAGFTDSVIRRMTRISNKYGAINLSQGFPDFDPPKEITNHLAEIANVGPHQYAITWGAQNFREDVHHLIRFHFAKRDDTLNAALDRLSELDRKAKDYLR